MRDTLSLGPTPAEESCQQVGRDYDPIRARKECRAFVAQLYRAFPQASDLETFGFRITSNPHDFGSYLDVVAAYDDDDPAAVRLAFDVEGATPGQWDDDARKELGL